MSANTFGTIFRLSTFGESHGAALGAVIDGCPAGVTFEEAVLLGDLERRRPGVWDTRQVNSGRQETDAPEILSGIYEGKTLGTPIAVLVRNQDARSADYANIASRTGHADQVWKDKFGHVDPRGGGRSSGRETVARVIGGAFARMFLRQAFPTLRITGFAREIGKFKLTEEEIAFFLKEKQSADQFSARYPGCAHLKIKEALLAAQAAGDSLGGIAEIRVEGMPQGLGQPVFHKLKADLAGAMLGVGAVSSFELGSSAEGKTGAQFHQDPHGASYGGILGGISTGDDLIFRVGFKPTSSIMDVAKKGRHDPCIVPRAIPVLEAMTAMVLADHALWMRGDRVPALGTS